MISDRGYRMTHKPSKSSFFSFLNLQNIRSSIRRRFKGDFIFKIFTASVASSILIIMISIFVMLIKDSWLSITTYGINFLFGTQWKPYTTGSERPIFSALPLIFGTTVTSGIALFLSTPMSLGIALALTEFSKTRYRNIFAMLVELLAAIPSVIYGLWGIFILIPFLKNTIYPALQNMFYFIPFLQGKISGPSVLTGSIVLSIMILPTITAVMRDVIATVPSEQRESIIALGATKWETGKMLIKYSKSGIIGAIVLGLGRAVGETMAITMVIGNSFNMFSSLFQPGYTLPSIIANEFTEASSPPEYLSALMEIGLILLVFAIMINAIAQIIVRRSTVRN